MHKDIVWKEDNRLSQDNGAGKVYRGSDSSARGRFRSEGKERKRERARETEKADKTSKQRRRQPTLCGLYDGKEVIEGGKHVLHLHHDGEQVVCVSFSKIARTNRKKTEA